MAAINVKVKTAKVITALENKLAELKAAETTNEKLREEYDAAVAKYDVEVHEVVKNLAPKSVSTWKYGSTEVTVKYTILNDVLPPEPQHPDFIRVNTRAIPDIESAIRLLKMTDEETVNASTFKQISKFL